MVATYRNGVRVKREDVPSVGTPSSRSAQTPSLPSPPLNGPGTELKGLLTSLGIAEKPNCKCRQYMDQMNRWGVFGCKLQRNTIIEWLKSGQVKFGWKDKLLAAANAVKTGLAFQLNPLDPIPGLVDEAIRRAEERAKESPSSPVTASSATSTQAPLRGADTMPKSIVWAYGVTTVPERATRLLPRTLESLRLAGFPAPRLFVDGINGERLTRYEEQFKLEVTARSPTKIRTYGNWILALIELYVRNPKARRFALFQDDFVTYPNLREYLERTPYPEKGYLNLYTFPRNERFIPSNTQGKPKTGFYPSDQLGKGAVALVFDRDTMLTILANQKTATYLAQRPLDATRGTSSVDGGLVSALKLVGWKEYVHYPSLVQHTGLRSSMGNEQQPLASSFKGESYDALDLLKESARI